MTAWTHDGLMADLAAHLRAGGKHLTWTNMAAGGPGQPRPDVLMMRAWGYSNPSVIAYECKVSTGDFRSDVTSGKWQAYLQFAQGVTFAAPSGLVSAGDVPPSCGLILRSERGWRHVRKPTLTTAAHIPMAVWIKMVSTPPNRVNPFAYGDAEDATLRYHRSEIERRVDLHARHEIGKRYGEEIARYLKAPATAKEILDKAEADARSLRDEAEREADGILKQARKSVEAIADALALDPNLSSWALLSAVRERAARLSEFGAIRSLTSAISAVQKALDDSMALQRMATAELPTEPTNSDRPTV